MFDFFAHLRVPVADHLRTLLSISTKRELKRFSRDVVVTRREFSVLVFNANALGYVHNLQYHEFRPADAHLSKSDFDALHEPPGEQRTRNLRRFLGRVNRLFHQRRLFTAHIFINSERWHVFYFDQRDLQLSDNHWRHGSHIHFVNFLWPNYNPADIWTVLKRAETDINGALHIRYDPQQSDDTSGPAIL